MPKEVGEQCFYKTKFLKRLKKCEVIKVISHLLIDWETGRGARPYHIYQYVIRLENGKEKLVDAKDLL